MARKGLLTLQPASREAKLQPIAHPAPKTVQMVANRPPSQLMVACRCPLVPTPVLLPLVMGFEHHDGRGRATCNCPDDRHGDDSGKLGHGHVFGSGRGRDRLETGKQNGETATPRVGRFTQAGEVSFLPENILHLFFSPFKHSSSASDRKRKNNTRSPFNRHQAICIAVELFFSFLTMGDPDAVLATGQDAVLEAPTTQAKLKKRKADGAAHGRKKHAKTKNDADRKHKTHKTHKKRKKRKKRRLPSSSSDSIDSPKLSAASDDGESSTSNAEPAPLQAAPARQPVPAPQPAPAAQPRQRPVLRNSRGDELDWVMEGFRSMIMPMKFIKNMFEEVEFVIDRHPDPENRRLQLSMHSIVPGNVALVGFEYVPVCLRARKLPQTFRVLVSQLMHALECVDKKGTVRIYKQRDTDDRIVVEPQSDTFMNLRRYVALQSLDQDLATNPPDFTAADIRDFLNVPSSAGAVFSVKQLKSEFHCAIKSGCADVRLQILEQDGNVYFGVVSDASSLYKYCVVKKASDADANGKISYSVSDAVEMDPPNMNCLKFDMIKPQISMAFKADIIHGFLSAVEGAECQVSIGLTPDMPMIMRTLTDEDEYGVFKIRISENTEQENAFAGE
jgi:hypothetical protein